MRSLRPAIIITSLTTLVGYLLVYPLVLTGQHWQSFREVCASFCTSLITYISKPTNFVSVTVAAIFLLGLMHALWWTWRTLSAHRHYRLRPSDDCAMTIGLLTPHVVVSPTLRDQMSRDAYAALVAHEEYHRDHFHPLVLFTVGFLSKLFFFVPGSHRFYRQVVLHLELRADTHAAARTSEHSLAKAIQEYLIVGNPQTILHAAQFSVMKERVSILTGAKQRPAWSRAALLWPTIVTLIVGLLLPLYQARAGSITARDNVSPLASEATFACQEDISLWNIQTKLHQSPIIESQSRAQ